MRRHKKSLPWRRFGYVILIIIKFGELLLWISLTIIIINALRSYIKHLKECFIRYPNTLKLVKKTLLACTSFVQPISQCLDIWWNTLPCVWYILMKQTTCCYFYLKKKITNNLGGNWQWSMQIILHLFHPW